jgi:hypothetical protein
MSKGKHQASQNAKKLAAAQERIIELERDLLVLAKSAHLKEQELASELQALGNRFVSEVDVLAATKVENAKKEAQSRLEDAERRRVESIFSAMKYLVDNGDVRLTLDSWGKVAALLEVHPGTLIAHLNQGRANRNTRRANLAHINNVAELERTRL